jgi:hypothetical protein
MYVLRWQVLVGFFLILLSGIIFGLHYLIFHDVHNFFFYFLLDIAFVPIEVLIVTLIINGLLAERERKPRLQKMNMIVGAFFTEIGTKLLTILTDCDPGLEVIRGQLLISGQWTDQEFNKIGKKLESYAYQIDIQRVDLKLLKASLNDSREFFLRLLENQILLEHEHFTNLLWAVSHLTEELLFRPELTHLPAKDIAHLKIDTERVYSSLGKQWLEYMRHLKVSYPFLFSLALRTSPFDKSASVIIKD